LVQNKLGALLGLLRGRGQWGPPNMVNVKNRGSKTVNVKNKGQIRYIKTEFPSLDQPENSFFLGEGGLLSGKLGQTYWFGFGLQLQ